MASRKPHLTVSLSRAVENELDEIYRYSIGKHGQKTADRYIALLEEKIYGLATEHHRGKTVGANPGLRYLVIKKRSSGDGHLAVYRVDEAAVTVRVLFVFHTKQDWENKL